MTEGQGRPSASWVVKEKATGRAVLETFNPKVAAAVNKDRYEVVPILEYLQSLNTKAPQALSEQGTTTTKLTAI